MPFRPFSKRTDFEATADIIRKAYVQYHKPLFYFAYQQLKHKARAEDVVALAFVECWRDLTPQSKSKDLEDELYGFAQQFCHRHLNQFYRDRVLSEVFNSALSTDELSLKKIEAKTLQYLVN